MSQPTEDYVIVNTIIGAQPVEFDQLQPEEVDRILMDEHFTDWEMAIQAARACRLAAPVMEDRAAKLNAWLIDRHEGYLSMIDAKLARIP